MTSSRTHARAHGSTFWPGTRRSGRPAWLRPRWPTTKVEPFGCDVTFAPNRSLHRRPVSFVLVNGGERAKKTISDDDVTHTHARYSDDATWGMKRTNTHTHKLVRISSKRDRYLF